MKRSDLPSEELTDVAARILRALKPTGVLSMYALQYRLSETGHPGRRVTPRLLQRALAELENNRRPRAGQVPHPGPWKPLPEIYVHPAFTRTNSQQHAAVIAATHRAQLEQLAATLLARPVLPLAEAIAKALGAPAAPQPGPEREPIFIGGGIPLSRPSAFVQLELSSERSSLAWITNDPDWIYPDDPWLWRHVAHCAAGGTDPIIIARKLAPQTFSLAARLGAFAIELHHHYAASAQAEDAGERAERIDWPKIYPIDHVRSHGALEVLRTRLSDPPTNTIRVAALQAGVGLGLAEGDKPQPDLLLKWTLDSGIVLPPRWLPEIERWKQWQRYSPPRRSAP